VTIYIPVWLYWYGGMPLAFLLGYVLGRLHKTATMPRDPYRGPSWTDLAREHKEAPTTKRARPGEQTADEVHPWVTRGDL
jgi:hypothetical protein